MISAEALLLEEEGVGGRRGLAGRCINASFGAEIIRSIGSARRESSGL